MGAHDFKLNKVHLFALKSVNINVSVPSFIRIERGSDGST